MSKMEPAKGNAVEAALNKQLNEEMFSSNMYRAMQAYFMHCNLPGFANWCDVQAQEENFHARRIFDFINERKWRVEIHEIRAPRGDWESPLDAFKDANEHEASLTKRFYELYKLAEEQHDIATRIFLQWFISEQVEEEAMTDEAIAKVARVADSPAGMYMLDRELARRSVETPTTGDQVI